MSIKYNQFGEVVSVNGIVTGQHIGKPMQDAVAERPEDNEPYAREQSIVTNFDNVDNDFVPFNVASSVMTVNIDYSADTSSNVATSDKTYQEIMKHYNAGGEVRAIVRKEDNTSIRAILSITHYNNYYVFFSGVAATSNAGGVIDSFAGATMYAVTVGTDGAFCSYKSIV
jgi:hypothetical protein